MKFFFVFEQLKPIAVVYVNKHEAKISLIIAALLIFLHHINCKYLFLN